VDEARGDAGGGQQLPEEVGGVSVGVLLAGGLDAWVEANEENEEVGGYGVREVREVGVDGRGSVGRGGTRAGPLAG
jgi:hypothetical protein